MSAHDTLCPQLLRTLPHLAPFSQVWSAASGRQPQTPVTPPPPQVAPIAVQVVGHSTVRRQLFRIGPHFPPMHVVDAGSSVHVLQTPAVVSQPNEQTMSPPH